MRIQTRGNSNTVWLSSEAGVINGTMTLSVTPLEKILQAVNEKYGTSFEGWSQLPTAYEVGDTVPNWNAYEKMSAIRWAILYTGTSGVFGIVENNTYNVYINSGGNVLVTNNEGEIVGTQIYSADFANFMKQKLANAGVEVQNVEQFASSLDVGGNVPDWSLYNITN